VLKLKYCTCNSRYVHVFAGKGAGDVSESEFVDKIIHRLEGHGSSLTTSVKNDADWDTFRLATFTEKVNGLVLSS